MWDNKKITEAQLILSRVSPNQTRLNSAYVVAADLNVGDVAAMMDILWLHTVPLNL